MTSPSSDKPVILAIETSCDDTSVAVLFGEKPIVNLVSSQLDGLKFGGIVPELAARAHQRNILPVIREALTQAKILKQDIGLIAVTRGPGLIGSLLVGVNVAKGLAMSLQKPIVGVHHIEAHMLAAFLEAPDLQFPFLALVVSGGHTILVFAKGLGDYRIVGETVDDAAGECFDKVARILGVSPGDSVMAGPAIDRRAKFGDPKVYQFPRPMLKSGDFQFSFSGLKTSVLTFVQKLGRSLTESETNDACAGFQEAVVDVLTEKSIKACSELKVKQLVVCGGVAANSRLREKVVARCKNENIHLIIPAREYCTDNAAMIGVAGWKYFKNGHALTEVISRSTISLETI